MHFEIIGQIAQVETIASGKLIQEIMRLHKIYGRGQRRKCKGIATVRFADGTVCSAEVHWHEAHGIGRKEPKIKRIL